VIKSIAEGTKQKIQKSWKVP